jgi:VWFA-related protein
VSHRRSWRIALLTASVAALALVAHARAQTFRNSVNLVVVPVSVNDPDGKAVASLTLEDFKLTEDGHERPIADFSAERVAVSIGTLIDISGSMAGTRFADAQQAMGKLFERLTPDDRVFLATFNETFRLIAPWTADRAALTRALAAVRPSGGTFLYRAISNALPLLNAGPNRRKALVLISDGDDNESVGGVPNRAGLARAVAQATASDAVIYAVAIGWPKPPLEDMVRLLADPDFHRRLTYDPPIDVEQLRSLTDPTGGYTQLIPTSAQLSDTVIHVVDDLSQQYILGFEPAQAPDNKPHTLVVTVRDPHLIVRARTQYVAAVQP